MLWYNSILGRIITQRIMDISHTHSDNKTASACHCPLCDSHQVELLSNRNREGGPLRTVICLDCGLVWSDPFPHDPRAFYENDYRLAYKSSYQPQAKHVYRAGQVAVTRHQKIKHLINTPQTLLDVGVGGGEFAYLMKSLGHAVSGIEPNQGYANYAKTQYDLNLQIGFLQDAQFAENSFDVITIWHVLEHTEDPLQVLSRLGSWLKPQGILVVEVPNIEAVCQSPKSTFHDAHLFNFNLASLSKLAERAGLNTQQHLLSADGGNLTVFFNKAESAITVSDWHVPGNAEIIKRIVLNHTPFRHYTSLAPYSRLVGRLLRSIEEFKATRQSKDNKSLLDNLYSKLLKSA